MSDEMSDRDLIHFYGGMGIALIYVIGGFALPNGGMWGFTSVFSILLGVILASRAMAINPEGYNRRMWAAIGVEYDE